MVNRELETLEVRKQQTTYIASNITYVCMYVCMYIIMYLLAFIRIILSLICQIKDWLQK